MSVRFKLEEKLMMAGYAMRFKESSLWDKIIDGDRLTVCVAKGSYGSWLKRDGGTRMLGGDRLTYKNVEALELV